MSFSAEAWLMLLALALYVYDAALLFESDEFLLVHGSSGRWSPAFGANGWKLGGKEPMVPNLVSPWQSLVRVRWRFEDGLEGERSEQGLQLPNIGARAKVGVTVLLMLIFVAFPFCLFFYPVTAVTLSVVAVIYGTCVYVLIVLHREWAALGVKNQAFWKLCVECITCPPFCINAVRKASLLASCHVTLADIAADAEKHDSLNELKRQIVQRVLEQIDVETEGSERMAKLRRVVLASGAKEEP